MNILVHTAHTDSALDASSVATPLSRQPNSILLVTSHFSANKDRLESVGYAGVTRACRVSTHRPVHLQQLASQGELTPLYRPLCRGLTIVSQLARIFLLVFFRFTVSVR